MGDEFHRTETFGLSFGRGFKDRGVYGQSEEFHKCINETFDSKIEDNGFTLNLNYRGYGLLSEVAYAACNTQRRVP